jgi:ABC-2 type transport system ATP-binding protein
LLDAVRIGPERRFQLRKLSKGMLQRVGIAQALLNDPDLVIFDEPMSGLDPIGRREVRALILSLRDRGCTVFFSSHVLGDAEALCTRVAILVKGRLVACGRLSEMLAFEARGWELVVTGLAAGAIDALGSRVSRAVAIGPDRYHLDLAPGCVPEHVVAELTGAGARLVSLNPIRATLEDVFVEQVAGAPPSARHP